MNHVLKRLVSGFIYSLMTMSFVLAPIPKTNVVWASGVYTPGSELGDVVQKAKMERYTEHQDSFEKIFEQAVTGMMAVVFVKSLNRVLLPKLKGPDGKQLYGNDCDTKAPLWSLGLGTVGSLAYLVGDIKANRQFIKASKDAVDESFMPTPAQGGEDGTISEEEQKAHKNKQIRSFNTLIRILKKQKKGLEAKKKALAIAESAYVSAAGLELFNGLKCHKRCVTGKTAAEKKLIDFNAAVAQALKAIKAEAGTTVGQACAGAAVPALEALQSMTKAKKTKGEAQDSAKAAKAKAEQKKEEKEALSYFEKIKGYLAKKKDQVAGYVSGKTSQRTAVENSQKIYKPQVEKVEKLVKTQVKVDRYDDIKAKINGKEELIMVGEWTTEEPLFESISMAAKNCSTSRPAIAKAMREFISYFYTPVPCCGGPGHTKEVQAVIKKHRANLIKSALKVAPYGGVQELEFGEDNNLAEYYKEKGAPKVKFGPDNNFAEFYKKKGMEELDKLRTDVGTLPGFGLPKKPQYGSTKDVRIFGLFDGFGWKSNMGGGDDGVKAPKGSESASLDADSKYYVKHNFESLLRRLALAKQMKAFDPQNPAKEIKEIARLHQDVNNVMFYFNQIVEESNGANPVLAFQGFKEHELWPTVVKMVGNMIMPKAHAGFLGAAAGNAAKGAGFKMVVDALDINDTNWEAVLNVGPYFMMLQGMLGAFAKSTAFVSPWGRGLTYTTLEGITLVVKKLDEDAQGQIEKYIQVAVKERDRYAKSAGMGGVDGDPESSNGNLVANDRSRAYQGLNFGNGGVKSCAVPKGQGFAPAPCPAKVPKSAFTLPREGRKVVAGMPSPFQNSVNFTSKYARDLASGKMSADDLAGMDIGPIERANAAMRRYNDKMRGKMDQINNKSGVSSAPLAKISDRMKRAVMSPRGREVLASNPDLGKEALASIGKDGEEEKDGKKKGSSVPTRSSVFDSGSSAGASQSGDDGFDFGFDDEGGVEQGPNTREVSLSQEEGLGGLAVNHSDINKRKDVSIFKILSNRYLLSYPKVLEEKTKNE